MDGGETWGGCALAADPSYRAMFLDQGRGEQRVTMAPTHAPCRHMDIQLAGHPSRTVVHERHLTLRLVLSHMDVNGRSPLGLASRGSAQRAAGRLRL